MARPNAASFAQDKAAGGLPRRLLRLRNGDVVTVSMVVTPQKQGSRVNLRFRSGGFMVTRPVGVFNVEDHEDMLRLAWATVRGERIAEANNWTWVNP